MWKGRLPMVRGLAVASFTQGTATSLAQGEMESTNHYQVNETLCVPRRKTRLRKTRLRDPGNSVLKDLREISERETGR